MDKDEFTEYAKKVEDGWESDDEDIEDSLLYGKMLFYGS